ncbi:MAG: two-component regulator propeller domain-containing protein, partial [Chitinophagales bacterium]
PLPNQTIVRSLAIAEDGKIYVGGQDELGYFFPNERGILTYHSLRDKIAPEHQHFEDVWDIVVSKKEGLFFRTTTKIFHLQEENNMQVYSTGNYIHFLAEIGDVIFVHDEQSGLMNFKNGQLAQATEGIELKGMIVTSVLPFEEGSKLFATLKNGLFLLNEKGLQKWETANDDFLKKNRIYSAAKLKNGHFALATSMDGLVTINKSGRVIHHLNKKTGLQNNNVLSVFTDRNNNLWLGLDNGIDYLRTNSPFTILYPDEEQEGTAYSAQIHDGKIYFGTSHGVYYTDWKDYYDPFAFEQEGFRMVENTAGQVWALQVVGDELLLGHHEGTFRIEGNRAIKISSKNGVWSFLKSSEQSLIVGYYEGLMLFEEVNDKWAFRKKLENLEASCRIIAADENGTVWVAHPYRGIYKVLLKEEKTAIEEVQFYDSNAGLPSNLFNHVFNIGDGVIFAGEKGIYQYEEDKDSFEVYPTYNELLGAQNQVKRLVEDPQKNIWFVTNEEVGLLQLKDRGLEKEVKKRAFPELKGKLVGGFEYIYPYDQNNVFFGAEKGFIHFNPSKKTYGDSLVQVVVDEVYLEGEKDSLIFGGHFTGENGVELNQTVDNIPIFPNEVSAFRFHCAATCYEDAERVHYQYFLEGLDKEWSDWTLKTDKEYTNLSAGEYTFKVRVVNELGGNSEISTYSFEIAPPWYATNTAYAMYITAILALIGSLILIPRQQHKKETELLLFEQKRQEEEHQKIVEASQRTISDLKNEKLEAEIGHQEQKLATVALHLVQKNEILTTVRKELDKLSKTTSEATTKKEIKQLIRIFEEDARLDEDWEQFAFHFDQVHSNFLKRLRETYPQLSPKDHKLCAYLRMNLSTKEIAPLMNISVRGVEVGRYRLRKKLELDTEVNLVEFMLGF